MGYTEDKELRIKKAKAHNSEMCKKYGAEANSSIRYTRVYDTDFVSDTDKEVNTTIEVIDLDTVSAASKHCNDGKVALLNFASYKYPGGGFLTGSMAQEESLCHESNLYNILVSFNRTYYDWNHKHTNKSLYRNRGLYTPDVIFRDKEFTCDVITCAAPNKAAAQKYCGVNDKENTKALRERIKFILDIAKDNEVNTLILGAFGCGVFGQNPNEVAKVFKEYLESTHKCFNKVVFAIPKGRNGNLEAFKKVF